MLADCLSECRCLGVTLPMLMGAVLLAFVRLLSMLCYGLRLPLSYPDGCSVGPPLSCLGCSGGPPVAATLAPNCQLSTGQPADLCCIFESLLMILITQLFWPWLNHLW